MLAVVLAGVAASFKREIRAYEKYEVWTRVLGWDDKWVFFVSHFVRAGKVRREEGRGLQPGTQGKKKKKGKGAERDTAVEDKALLASIVSKCVLRLGRETMPPAKVFAAAGLLPDEKAEAEAWKAIEAERVKGLEVAGAMDGLGVAAHAAFKPAMGPVLAEYSDVWAWA